MLFDSVSGHHLTPFQGIFRIAAFLRPFSSQCVRVTLDASVAERMGLLGQSRLGRGIAGDERHDDPLISARFQLAPAGARRR